MADPTTTSTVSDSPKVPTILGTHDAVQQVRDRGPGVVIDVRTPVEWSTERIDGSRHIPLHELSKRVDEATSMDGPCLLLCRSGKRAEQARRTLAAAGVENATVIEGGIDGYAAAGGEVRRVAARMSLERQVRIAAGLLVVVGAAVGFLLHPLGYGLSAFVGAGLVFAGVTDTCGMGMMLAKMPWNKA